MWVKEGPKVVQVVTLDELLDEAGKLYLSPRPRSYLQGMVDLAASLFPVPGLEWEERKEEIWEKIKTRYAE